MTTYFKDAGGPPIVFPQWLIDLGFEDVSWHNDAMPHATWPIPASLWPRDFPPHEQDGFDLDVWIDYEDPALKELGENFPQYGVYVSYRMAPVHCSSFVMCLYQGDNEALAEDIVKRYQSLFRTSHDYMAAP